MRWGAVVAAACCAALAALRWSEGEQLLGGIFAAAAVLYVCLAVAAYRKEGANRGPRLRREEAYEVPPMEKIARTLDVFKSRSRGWLWLAVSGWLAATASVFTSLPVAMILAALSAYATVRYRYYTHYTGVLKRALAAQKR